MAAAPEAGSSGGSHAVRQRIAQEKKTYEEQLAQVALLLGDQKRRTAEARQKVADLEALCADIRAECEAARQDVQKKQDKRKGSAPSGAAEAGPQNTAQAAKELAAEHGRRAAPVFVQSLCKYHKQERAKQDGGGKFWKKEKKDSRSDDDPRLQSMRLEMPQGAMGPARTTASAFALTIACADPQATRSRTLDDLASEGATTRLVFSLKEDTKPEELEPLLAAARQYFERYFAERARDEGATPEVKTEIVGRRLISTATVTVGDARRAQGMLAKVQKLAAGELSELMSRRDSPSDASPTSATESPTPVGSPLEDGRDAKGRHPVLGQYSEEQCRDALRMLQHTQFHCSFEMQSSFGDLFKDGQLDWDFFNYCSGHAETTLARIVYKALQRVVEVYSTIAAAKMSLGGKFYKRMTFRLDGGLFRALREDRELASALDRNVQRLLGHRVAIDDRVVENLRVLSASVATLDQFRVVLPGVTLHAQFQGLDFFGITRRGVELKLARSHADPHAV
eukprot:TRINITY_DN16517_c0_g1_i1.p1 TRINITY_DN16517_c0_g1~~TRINITY_DN16517_c0_g1_i1.p1  ORF type:complete len:535 (+),score=161.50 TRINITY_DN16517_c0_g1_i1:78-1607(+)